jgi:hypothetical protein
MGCKLPSAVFAKATVAKNGAILLGSSVVCDAHAIIALVCCESGRDPRDVPGRNQRQEAGILAGRG